MPRHTLSRQDRSKGGRIVARLPGRACPRCGQSFPTHAKFAGHLGLHAFADKYCQGDLAAARQKLAIIGAAASDPFPQNGAYAEGHRFLAQRRRERDG